MRSAQFTAPIVVSLLLLACSGADEAADDDTSDTTVPGGSCRIGVSLGGAVAHQLFGAQDAACGSSFGGDAGVYTVFIPGDGGPIEAFTVDVPALAEAAQRDAEDDVTINGLALRTVRIGSDRRSEVDRRHLRDQRLGRGHVGDRQVIADGGELLPHRLHGRVVVRVYDGLLRAPLEDLDDRAVGCLHGDGGAVGRQALGTEPGDVRAHELAQSVSHVWFRSVAYDDDSSHQILGAFLTRPRRNENAEVTIAALLTEPSAVSRQLLHEAGEHPPHFAHLGIELPVGVGGEVSEVASEEQLVLGLARRAGGDAEEARELALPFAAASAFTASSNGSVEPRPAADADG